MVTFSGSMLIPETEEQKKSRTCDICEFFREDHCRRYPPVNVLYPRPMQETDGRVEFTNYVEYPYLGKNHPRCGEFRLNRDFSIFNEKIDHSERN
jgi:hypothetical protein